MPANIHASTCFATKVSPNLSSCKLLAPLWSDLNLVSRLSLENNVLVNKVCVKMLSTDGVAEVTPPE